MILFDLSHTSHTTAQTGIQRVCRGFFYELSQRKKTEPVTYDPYEENWRPLNGQERLTLSSSHAAAKRGAQWQLSTRVKGKLKRILGLSLHALPVADAVIVPEIFSSRVAAKFSPLLAAAKGPRVALFHDAIALKCPELSPAKTVARFPGYLQELLVFDAVAAVSEDSRSTLIDYWKWLGIVNPPPVQTITLPLNRKTSLAPRSKDHSLPPTILCVGSIEGRKNHLALLNACEDLWSKGREFKLRLIGLAHAETGKAAMGRLRELRANGRPLIYDGPVDDQTLFCAYSEASFTVYPSLLEGFGLPVLESLSYGKPCVCSARGALGESARGGGCLALDQMDVPLLSSAIDQLITDKELRATLATEATQRRFKLWKDYTDEFLDWLGTISRRAS